MLDARFEKLCLLGFPKKGGETKKLRRSENMDAAQQVSSVIFAFKLILQNKWYCSRQWI